MRVKDMATEALVTQNSKMALKLTAALRDGQLKFKGQPVLFRYDEVIEFVSRATGKPIAEVGPEWEALLYEAEGGVK